MFWIEHPASYPVLTLIRRRTIAPLQQTDRNVGASSERVHAYQGIRPTAHPAADACFEIEHEFHIFLHGRDHNECEVPRPIWR
jgi:hypothetical protein